MHSGRMNRRLFFVVSLLLLIGVVMVYSSSWPYALSTGLPAYHYGLRHMVFGGAGFVLMIAVSYVDYSIYKKLCIPIYVLAMLVNLLVFTPLGTNHGTFARRWIVIGPIEFMSSDLLKIAGIIMISDFLVKRDKVKNRFKEGFLPIMGLILLTVVPVILQPDLSTTITIVATLGSIYFISGLYWQYFLLAIPVGALAGVFLFMGEKNAYRLKRIRIFLNPLEDYLDSGWQLSQALFAVSSGGLLGLGIGKGRQKFLYLSESHNDFIFAVIAEELGFVGSVFVIVLFLLFIRTGFQIAMNAGDTYGTYLASGITVLIGLQALINIGVSFGAIPPTGLVLPLISYGGTSLLVTMGMIGILLNISRYPSRKRGLS